MIIVWLLLAIGIAGGLEQNRMSLGQALLLWALCLALIAYEACRMRYKERIEFLEKNSRCRAATKKS